MRPRLGKSRVSGLRVPACPARAVAAVADPHGPIVPRPPVPVRILCTGDLHLGRSSSSLPSSVPIASVSAARCLERIVDYALAQEMDLVALSGDVVDEDNRYYEALGPLEKQLGRLVTAGIPTVVVAGNHDAGVLPELKRILSSDRFHLLGTSEKWERHVVTGRDGATLNVDGWSFGARHARVNPLATYDLPHEPGALTLGLLHTDLDQPGSPYAPTSLSELQARPVAMWLLGHVHSPGIRNPGAKVPVLYPGSPQALDPGEPGAHGAWVAEILPGRAPVLTQVGLSSVRYDARAIDLSGTMSMEDARAKVALDVRQALLEAEHESTHLEHLSLRVRLVGRCALHGELELEGARMCHDLELSTGSAVARVEQLDVAVQPVLDLEALAAGPSQGAVAWLARLLQSIESGKGIAQYPELEGMLDAIPATLNAAKPYRGLDHARVDDDDRSLPQELATQAALLLDELLEQQEVSL